MGDGAEDAGALVGHGPNEGPLATEKASIGALFVERVQVSLSRF